MLLGKVHGLSMKLLDAMHDSNAMIEYLFFSFCSTLFYFSLFAP